MKEELKLTYLKKSKKFLDKNKSVITEVEDIGFRGDIYK